jgi:hypothetical protein
MAEEMDGNVNREGKRIFAECMERVLGKDSFRFDPEIREKINKIYLSRILESIT